MEPYFDRFEYLMGTSGTAGNVKGVKTPGGNPFEDPRFARIPDPGRRRNRMARRCSAMPRPSWVTTPYTQPSCNLSEPYKNPECGFQMGYLHVLWVL